ncbi:MAG: putative histidine kinase [Solirubrobacteraceae bacterium]|nr:putative histidine kinase [Solirubrobacteraceae bacterium]
MGSWTYSPRTQELRWSDNHFRLWGLTPGAIVPTNEWVLAHVHPADRPRAEAALYGLDESDHTTEIEYRVVCDDDLVRHFRVTVAFDEEDEAGDRRLFGTVQDLTSQDSLARHLAAHAAVSKALDEWATFDEGAVGLLAGLGTAMNMPVGVLWVPRPTILVATAVWNAESALLPDVVDAMRDGRPGRGDATLGRAWSERRPIVSSDPARGASPRRAAAMRYAGVVATAAIPAVASDEALAILELHSTEPLEPSDRTLRALVGMGHEIGYFLSQRKGQLGEPVLTPREKEVLQLAADGVSAATIALRLEVSSATVKRHFEDAYARLGVGDRASAVAAAMRQGFID